MPIGRLALLPAGASLQGEPLPVVPGVLPGVRLADVPRRLPDEQRIAGAVPDVGELGVEADDERAVALEMIAVARVRRGVVAIPEQLDRAGDAE
jgi:hypothetical protein